MNLFEKIPVLCVIPKTLNCIGNFLEECVTPKEKEEIEKENFYFPPQINPKFELPKEVKNNIAQALHTITPEEIESKFNKLVAEENTIIKDTPKKRKSPVKFRGKAKRKYTYHKFTAAEIAIVKEVQAQRLANNTDKSKNHITLAEMADVLNKRLGIIKSPSTYHKYMNL